MRKLALTILTILSLFLVACTTVPESKLDTLLGQLELTFSTGDTNQSVTTNFSLPSSFGDATITWESNNTSALSIVGSVAQVNRGASDTNVVLTAELTLGDESKDKSFNLTIKALDANETYYTITWSIDGATTTTSVLENTLPSHVAPTKEGYVFVGWEPIIVAATANATYTALFELDDSEVPGEIDGAALDLAIGKAIYHLLPTIISTDYEITDLSDEDYPIDIYIDLFDWDEADFLAFEALLEDSLSYDEEEMAYVVSDLFIYIYLDEMSYDEPVYSINIYTYDDSGSNPDPDPDTNFNGAALDALLGASIYQQLPEIVTADYEMTDESSAEYPIDIFIDLFDFTEADFLAYEAALEDKLVYDAEEMAYVVGNFFIYIYLEEEVYETPVYSINIYTYDDSGTNPDPEPGVDGEIVVTSIYTSKNEANIADGDISSHFNFVSGGPTMTVTFAKNNSQVITLFNNDAGQTRIYYGANSSNNGGALTYEIESGYQIIGVSVLIGTNNVGLSINGSAVDTTKNGLIETIFITPVQTVKLQNVVEATGGRVDIVSVTFYYVGGEAQTIETWTEAVDQLETLLNVYALDELLPEITGLSLFNIIPFDAGYLLTASPVEGDGTTILSGYVTTLLGEGWVLDEELSSEIDTYVYEINPELALKLILEGDTDIIYLYVELFNPNLTDGNLSSLGTVQSITEMEYEKFGKSGLPSVGTYDVLVVPVEIKDRPFPVDFMTNIDLVFNGTEAETGWESVKSYYEQSSFGKLNITFEVTNKYVTQYDYAQYNSERDDLDIIDEALTALEGLIDFAQYDYNNDGVVDSMIFIYSADYDYDSTGPWWAWVSTLSNSTVVNGKTVEYFMWASYAFMEDEIPGYTLELNAETYIHELGHLLGSLDLYSGTNDYGPIGGWDMMDYNVGDHGPATKLLFGWLNPLVAKVGNYQVTLDSYTLDTDGGNSVLLIPYNSADLNDGDAFDEYLLVMFYTPGGLYNAHYNTTLSVEDAAVVIYRIDARLNEEFGFWDYYFVNDNDGTANFFIEILEVDGNSSIPTSATDGYLKPSDLLTSGSINFKNLYDWHQGGDIDVMISIASSFDNNSESITLNLTVN